jgi:hypothetical protein
MSLKLNCLHADTCLPDYWAGHHLPHVQVPVDNKMTIGQLRGAIRAELRQGAVAGSTDDARLLSADMVRPDEVKRADALTRAAYAAVNRDVKMHKSGARFPFKDLPGTEDDDSSVYAYFVFKEVD